MRTLIGTILAMAFVAAAADESLMLMRLRGPHTADDAARDCRVERWVAGLVKQ